MPTIQHNPKQQQQPQQHEESLLLDRVILLLDLDCFYAQCERIRLGLDNPDDCCLALLQWNSCLAVTYPARVYGIQRGDSFAQVAEKSKGKCLAVHVPLLETTTTTATPNTTTVDWNGDYESVYCLSPTQQQQQRQQDVGRQRFSTEGKACLERYRVASRRIFDIVQECLGINVPSTTSTTPNNRNLPKTGIVLEKASIDEFFLDVTSVCHNPDHPLWDRIHQSLESATSGSDHATAPKECKSLVDKHRTVMVASESNMEELLDMDPITLTNSKRATLDPALERGCLLANYIRQSVVTKLGFTLSAGISVNKMVAKLAASYGKPNGQAVVSPDKVLAVMHATKMSKVRYFGEKLGKAILALLPPDAPPTMGSVAQYLPLPLLQQHFGSSTTGTMIYQACRGHDHEPVLAKNAGNVVKSITAFKSLPRSVSDADVQDPSFLAWLELLVQEVVTRVDTDAQRNHRYPRNATIQYGCEGNLTAAGRLEMKSFRVPFPAQPWPVPQRIQHLMEIVPTKIIARETNSSSTTKPSSVPRKRIRIVRIGVSATEMKEDAKKHGSIASFFSATTTNSTRPVAAVAEKKGATMTPDSSSSLFPESEHGTTPAEATKKLSNPYEKNSTPSPKTSSATPLDESEHSDMHVARELQKAFDRENQTLRVLDNKSISPSSATKQSTSAADGTSTSSNSRTVAIDTTQSATAPSSKRPSEGGNVDEADPDLEIAKRLQASYDRENVVLGSWDSIKKKALTNSSRRAPKKKAKTQKISSFFRVSK